MLVNSVNLLVYILFLMFVQMVVLKDCSLKDIGFFGFELNLGNYIDLLVNYVWFGVYVIYMIIGVVVLFICYKCIKECVVVIVEQIVNVKIIDFFYEFRYNCLLVIFGMFFMLVFIFMFFMNIVNGFFNQFVVGYFEWMGVVGFVVFIFGIVFLVFWLKLKKIFGKKGFFYLFFVMFIVGELLIYVWFCEGMYDVLWLVYIVIFIKQWGLIFVIGFMWVLVLEVIVYGELKLGKCNVVIINVIMGFFFKIGFIIGGVILLWLLVVYGFNESGVVQSVSVIDGIIMIVVWILIVLVVILMVIMQVYLIFDKYVIDINCQLDEICVQLKKL